MDVYDFDGVIYSGNCSFDFYTFLHEEDREILKYVPVHLLKLLLPQIYRNKESSTERNYLSEIDVNKKVESFWNKYENKLLNHSGIDLIITTSPEFLVYPGVRRMGVTNVIGTRIDLTTGIPIGKLCICREKLRRFREKYGESAMIDNFYTDSSILDKPLIDISRNHFILNRSKSKN